MIHSSVWRRPVRYLGYLYVVITSLGLAASLLWHCAAAAPAPAGGLFLTSPPGSALPSDAECARRVQRNAWEPRPENTAANHRVPAGRVQSRSWGSVRADELAGRVTGNFTGTTDEILQWASCKWGFDTDVTRAQAVQESNWTQTYVGDGGISFGLMQIKSTVWSGTYPWSANSTAYNVDWSLGKRRACFEGYEYGQQARGDLWGCVGVHYSGIWGDAGAQDYTAKVQDIYLRRTWLEWPSARGEPPTSTR